MFVVFGLCWKCFGHVLSDEVGKAQVRQVPAGFQAGSKELCEAAGFFALVRE